MAKQVQLKAQMRNVTGKTQVKRLRANGAVPGSVYGTHTKPYNITVSTRELGDVLHRATGENVLVGPAMVRRSVRRTSNSSRSARRRQPRCPSFSRSQSLDDANHRRGLSCHP